MTSRRIVRTSTGTTRAVTTALALTTAVALAGCGGRGSDEASSGSSGASGSGDLVVAATYPQSGALAITSAAGRGVEAAIDEANAAGGVQGQEIVWKDYDDAYDPARMNANARKAIQQDDADVVVSFGGPSLAIRPFVNAQEVVNIVLAGNTPLSDETFPWTHAAFPDLGWEASIVAQELARTKPDAKVGVIGFNNDLTDSQVAGIQAGGFEPELVLKVPPTQQDVTSQITQMKNAGIDTIFSSVAVGQVIGAVKYMEAVGYDPTLVLYSLQAGKADAITALGPAATGIYTGLWTADPGDPLWAEESDVAAFKAAIADSGTETDADNILALMGYITGRALVAAMESADSLDPAGINAAWTELSGVTVPGLPPGTTLDFGPGGRLMDTYQVTQWDGTAWQPVGSPVDAEEAGLTD